MPAPADTIHTAAEVGDLERINAFLAKGEPVEKRDARGRTPLMCAIYGRHADVVQCLLEEGAAVDGQTASGETPLHMAARAGDAEIVQLLLAHGADPNQFVSPQPKRSEVASPPCRGGVKTLIDAITGGNLEIVTALLDAGIDTVGVEVIGKTNPFKPIRCYTPLSWAAGSGNLDIVRVLIQRGADVNETHDEPTWTPLENAIFAGDVAIASLLFEAGADPTRGATNLLKSAIQNGDTDMVALLLKQGLTLSQEALDTPFRSFTGVKPEITALLERYQGTDWHRAVLKGDLEAVRTRLDEGVSIDAHDRNGATALHRAAEKDQLEIAKLLIDRGADLNAEDIVAQTPLTIAVMKPHVEMARLLIVSGADFDASLLLGRIALRGIESPEKREMHDLLLAHGAYVGLVEALFFGDNTRLHTLLKSGTPVDTPNERGMTALMACAVQGDLHTARLLRDTWGADPNAGDSRGDTALFYAVRTHAPDGGTDFVRQLLDWGVPVYAENEEGETALHYAILYHNDAGMSLLLERGADPNHFRPQGDATRTGMPLTHTALMMAIASTRGFSSLQTLLRYGADPNQRMTIAGSSGDTPLLSAVKRCTTHSMMTRIPVPESINRILPIIRLLIEYGADVNAGTETYDVLDLALQTENAEIVRLLVDAGAKMERDYLDDFANVRRSVKVRFLLENDAEPDTKAAQGDVFPSSVLQNQTKSIGRLLKNGLALWRRQWQKHLLQQKRRSRTQK